MPPNPTSPEQRARKKMKQLQAEFEKPELNWHNLAHLVRDLGAVIINTNAAQKK